MNFYHTRTDSKPIKIVNFSHKKRLLGGLNYFTFKILRHIKLHSLRGFKNRDLPT